MMISIFTARLKDLLEFSGKKDGDLATETGIERKSIYNWLNGATYPSAKALLILADYFKVSVDYILGLDDREEERLAKNPTVEEAQKCLLKNLNGYLKENACTKYKLAKSLGVGQGTLSRWFEEGAMPEAAILIKIGKLLDKPLDELLGRN